MQHRWQIRYPPRYQVLGGVLIAACFVVIFLFQIRPKSTSVSATFKGYGTLPEYPWYSNRVFGVFTISNTGPSRLFFRGVADSSHQLVKVSSLHGLDRH
jgi:hypothetical protein